MVIINCNIQSHSLTLDTLSSFSTPNVHIMWICGWMRGPKSRHIFHCSPYHIGVSCYELTIQQRTVQHSQQIYITIQKFALSKWNAMMSFNEISEEHISGTLTLVNTVKASGFQNMKKTNHSPNVCPLPSMIRSDNFCIASNSRRMGWGGLDGRDLFSLHLFTPAMSLHCSVTPSLFNH